MESLEWAFQAYGEPLETVTSFTYLVRLLMVGCNDWTAMADNLRKARKSWKNMMRILIREGEDPGISGLFFKVVV